MMQFYAFHKICKMSEYNVLYIATKAITLQLDFPFTPKSSVYIMCRFQTYSDLEEELNKYKNSCSSALKIIG